ncbi:NADP-dependent isocitrate dehydrogenase, partial [bacterium]|nr:NADP-dependent isocitrate dehydrogenase [bacterium]
CTLIEKAFEATLKDKVVTYDFARQLAGAREVKCSEFARAICEHM